MKPSTENESSILTRRRMLLSGGAALAGVVVARTLSAAETATTAPTTAPGLLSLEVISKMSPAEAGRDYTPVITPNGSTLPWKLIDGVKVFHLVAEEVEHELCPGLTARCWGYNGRVHGPTIETAVGDRVRLYVTNRLPEATTVHWHGMPLPSGMDGVGGLSQKLIRPGETFRYEFPLRRPGTFMYHPHHDEMTQMALGMMGIFIVHARQPAADRPDRDFAMMLSEWRIEPGAERPDPTEMTDFNILTFNARAFPGTEPLVVKSGQRVRIRFGNLGAMDHHPIHLHNYSFYLTATDGGEVPPSARWPETTVLVPVGTTRDVEFIADEPGDWAMHCHMTHHAMNQMGHNIPNLIGIDPQKLTGAVKPLLPAYMTMGNTGMGEHGRHMQHMPIPHNSIPMKGLDGPWDYIDMGGMFTILKVRDQLNSYADPGWYQPPAGTQSIEATAEELRRDGIDVPAATKPSSSTYTCQHHPEVISSTPGNCPKCGMKLIPKS